LTLSVRIGTIPVMTQHHDILRELDEYAALAKVDPSTVCRKATGNPRLRERLAKRIERMSADADRLRKYMAENPPVESGSGSLACDNNVPASTDDCKGGAA